MANRNDVLARLSAAGSVHDIIRREYLARLHAVTGRNVVIYYSGWLEKSQLVQAGVPGFDVNDSDKNGFMSAFHQLDRSLGLDLLLHTPGGDIAATESIVDYIRSMFGTDVRVIVPQLAMSAGTMISLSGKEIVMGKHSSLGPIDPQIAGVPAHGVVEEFNRAVADIQSNPATIPVWQPIIAKYSPTLIGECEKAIKWGNSMVKAWLETGMFEGDADAAGKADTVLAELASHALTLSHARHISADKATSLGLRITRLEQDQDLQDAVLTVHHACVQTLAATPAIKIIENHEGVAHIQAVRLQSSPTAL